MYRKCSAVPHAKQCQHRKAGTPSKPWSRNGWPTRDDRPPSLASTSGDRREEDTITVHASSEPTHAMDSTWSSTRYSPYDKAYRSRPLSDLSNISQPQTSYGDNIDYALELPSIHSSTGPQSAIPTVPLRALSMPFMGKLIFDVEGLTPPSDDCFGLLPEASSDEGFLLSSSTSLVLGSNRTALVSEDSYPPLFAGGESTSDHDSSSTDWSLLSYPLSIDNLTSRNQMYSASSDAQPEPMPYLVASSLEPSLPDFAHFSRINDESSPLLEDFQRMATGSSTLAVDTSSFDWLFS